MSSSHDDPSSEEYGYESPTAEEVAQMYGASTAEAEAVDTLLVSVCSHHWRKVAMIVATLMDRYDAQFPRLPFAYMQVRILALIERGVLESQGNVMRMRHAEVRLSGRNHEA